MAEQIKDGFNGANNWLKVNDDGSINTNSISSSIGSTYNFSVTPTLSSQNPYTTLVYISSGTNTGLTTGSSIGSIIKFIGAGSYVKVLKYSNDNLINIGSWS